jgi:hypothetical protein
LKKQCPGLAEVNSHSLQVVCHNLGQAYLWFFKKLGGLPVYKKSGRQSFIAVEQRA